MRGLGSFYFDIPVRIRFGCGVMDEIARIDLPGRRVMVVTSGKTIQNNGTLDRLIEAIKKKTEYLAVFTDVSANPALTSVQNGASTAGSNNVNCIIALGGGSAMDTAKGIAAMAVNEGCLWDYTSSGSGGGKSLQIKPLPVVMIPTTAGTGSEANKTAVITDVERNEKIGFRTDFAHSAYVDPELTLSVPPNLTAVQGFDAFCHCFEALLSVKANSMSDILAQEGLKKIYNWLPTAVNSGSDIEARFHMSHGSLLGGMVLYLSSATAAHTLEHALSGLNPEISHGAGLSMIFNAYHGVISKNFPHPYAEIAEILGIAKQNTTENRNAEALLENLKEWKEKLGLEKFHLSDYGFGYEMASKVVELTHWIGGGPLRRDRYLLTDDDLSEIYCKSL